MTRGECLESARRAVSGQRVQDYGTPEDSFNRIAALWSAYIGRHFDAHEVAMMMALMKVARIQGGIGTDDSYVDLAGYAACAAEIKAAEAAVKKGNASQTGTRPLR